MRQTASKKDPIAGAEYLDILLLYRPSSNFFVKSYLLLHPHDVFHPE